MEALWKIVLSLILWIGGLSARGQSTSPSDSLPTQTTEMTSTPKLKIEIWSDVMCPFCYIGKRKFEQALKTFEHRDQIEITWKSFLLDPDAETQPDKSIYAYLAERKGQTLEWSKNAHQSVAAMAKDVGLDYHFDDVVVANSFDAHRLIQFAQSRGLGDEAEERIFRAYFTEGRNVADRETLVTLGSEIGLPESEIRQMLESTAWSAEVKRDYEEAGRVGARGVPFFVFDRKYAVSGAQDPSVFLQTLEAAWKEWRASNPIIEIKGEGPVCAPTGLCD